MTHPDVPTPALVWDSSFYRALRRVSLADPLRLLVARRVGVFAVDCPAVEGADMFLGVPALLISAGFSARVGGLWKRSARRRPRILCLSIEIVFLFVVYISSSDV